MALLATLALAFGAPPAQPPPAYWERLDGCRHGHRAEVALDGLDRLLRNHRPMTPARRLHATHLRRCTTTRDGRRRTERRARRLRDWRTSYAHRWPIAFNRLEPWERAWARSTSSCESGMNPAAHNPSGIYHGAFQFLLSTWWAAGGQGDPHAHSWAYQAVVAVRWMRRAGAGQWPVCGR